MSEYQISLNFFEEELSIYPPPSLADLRQKITEKFSFKKTESDEIILSYIKNSKTIKLLTEEDYKAFLDLKISKIKISIRKNSHTSKDHKDNSAKLKQEKEKDEKKLKAYI